MLRGDWYKDSDPALVDERRRCQSLLDRFNGTAATADEVLGADGYLLVAIYFIVLQFVMVTAVALLFSSFSSPLLSAVFAFALFIIGTFAEDLRAPSAHPRGFGGVPVAFPPHDPRSGCPPERLQPGCVRGFPAEETLLGPAARHHHLLPEARRVPVQFGHHQPERDRVGDLALVQQPEHDPGYRACRGLQPAGQPVLFLLPQ